MLRKTEIKSISTCIWPVEVLMNLGMILFVSFLIYHRKYTVLFVYQNHLNNCFRHRFFLVHIVSYDILIIISSSNNSFITSEMICIIVDINI
jgi:hypothetical protein